MLVFIVTASDREAATHGLLSVFDHLRHKVGLCGESVAYVGFGPHGYYAATDGLGEFEYEHERIARHYLVFETYVVYLEEVCGVVFGIGHRA